MAPVKLEPPEDWRQDPAEIDTALLSCSIICLQHLLYSSLPGPSLPGAQKIRQCQSKFELLVSFHLFLFDIFLFKKRMLSARKWEFQKCAAGQPLGDHFGGILGSLVTAAEGLPQGSPRG